MVPKVAALRTDFVWLANCLRAHQRIATVPVRLAHQLAWPARDGTMPQLLSSCSRRPSCSCSARRYRYGNAAVTSLVFISVRKIATVASSFTGAKTIFLPCIYAGLN